jgi:acyl-coenzyme A thioesterase PaaI-like protein
VDGADARPAAAWAAPSTRASEPDKAEFERLVCSVREFQEALTASHPTAEVMREVRSLVAGATSRLSPYAVPESGQLAGHLQEYPGRAQALAPVFVPGEWDSDHSAGHVTLGRFYIGGNGAAHGGALPLLFDEVLGRLANTGRTRSRTAFLHVDYRAITPIGPRLDVRARVDRIDGRKRWLSGEVTHDGVVCAEATGLFVELRDGQP